MTFTSETRPLLSESSSTNVFSGGSYRYSLEQKRILVAMVSICGLLPREHISEAHWHDAASCLLHPPSCYTRSVYTGYTANCWRFEFNRSNHRVWKDIWSFAFFFHAGFVPSLAVSLSVFSASLGGLLSSSYSTFCKWEDAHLLVLRWSCSFLLIAAATPKTAAAPFTYGPYPFSHLLLLVLHPPQPLRNSCFGGFYKFSVLLRGCW